MGSIGAMSGLAGRNRRLQVADEWRSLVGLEDDIRAIAASIPAELTEENGTFRLVHTVAERKMFFFRQKLVYSARFRIDETAKELVFTEMLKETGAGLGGDAESGPGFGFKAHAYTSGPGPREGTLEERSTLFRKKYDYTFDFGRIREKMETAAAASGYGFTYRLMM